MPINVNTFEQLWTSVPVYPWVSPKLSHTPRHGHLRRCSADTRSSGSAAGGARRGECCMPGKAVIPPYYALWYGGIPASRPPLLLRFTVGHTFRTCSVLTFCTFMTKRAYQAALLPVSQPTVKRVN